MITDQSRFLNIAICRCGESHAFLRSFIVRTKKLIHQQCGSSGRPTSGSQLSTSLNTAMDHKMPAELELWTSIFSQAFSNASSFAMESGKREVLTWRRCGKPRGLGMRKLFFSLVFLCPSLFPIKEDFFCPIHPL